MIFRKGTNNKLKDIFDLFAFKWIIIPLLLVFLWLTLTFIQILNVDKSLTLLSYSYGKETFTSVPSNQLLKGESIRGEFTAQDNYLGIIELPLQVKEAVNYDDEDKLIFRIKEKGSETWYNQNTYRSGLFLGVNLFPFGFPPIANSKGKIYQFELLSLQGTSQNGLIIPSHLFINSKYQYPKNLLLKNKTVLRYFLSKKLSEYVINPLIILPSIIFFLPILFYFIWHISLYKNSKYFHGLLLFSIIYTFLDIIFLPLDFSSIYILLILLWIVVVVKNNLDGSVLYFFALVFLLLSPIFLFFKLQLIAEKSTLWVYLFLVIGTIENIYQMNSNTDKKISYKEIVNEILIIFRIKNK